MRALLLACLVAPAAVAQTVECPQSHQSQRLTSAAIRAGAEHQAELAGGDETKTRGGYEILYRFPGHEAKWLACYYGSKGDVEQYKRMDERTTECRLQVRESRAAVTAKMTCELSRPGITRPAAAR
jgi:hypothetical protein